MSFLSLYAFLGYFVFSSAFVLTMIFVNSSNRTFLVVSLKREFISITCDCFFETISIIVRATLFEASPSALPTYFS